MAVVPSTLPRQVFSYRFFSVSDTLYCLLYHENCASPPLSWEGIPLKNIINFFPFKSSPAFYPFFPDTSFLSLASSFASFPSSSLRRTTGYSPAHVRVHRFILALLLSSHSHLSYLSPSEIELDRGFNKSRYFQGWDEISFSKLPHGWSDASMWLFSTTFSARYFLNPERTY